MSEEIYLQVPQKYYNDDAEINLISMLDFVIQSQREVLTPEELQRVVTWFSDRYSKEFQGQDS